MLVLHNAKILATVRTILLFITLLVTGSLVGQSITTIAGNGTQGYSGDGGPATAARLKNPLGLALDASGNLYVADVYNNVIRRISPGGMITTIAGTGVADYSGDGGPATAAKLSWPAGIAIDQTGNIYFSDQVNDVIRKINTAGIITTIAGIERHGYSGDGGPAISAKLYVPVGIAIDKTGNVFFADAFNHVIRKIDKSGIITTVAGNGTEGYSGDGGAAVNARLRFPAGVEIDGSGNLYIADTDNSVIRKVDASGIITTIAGNGTNGYGADGGPAAASVLNKPALIRFDSQGNLIVADVNNHVIRRIDGSGITTIAGSGIRGYSGDGGDPLQARLSNPGAVAIDNTGVFYISDCNNNVIRRVDPCKDIISMPVSIAASSREICENDSVVFSASVAAAPLNASYGWTINGAPTDRKGATITLKGLKNGDRIQCLFSPGLVCSKVSASEPVSISVHPQPVVELGPEIFIEEGEHVQLHARSSTPVSTYKWLPSAGLDNAAIRDPVASPALTTNYLVEVTSEFGCKATGNIMINIFRKLYMPDGFTPNNDGKNDVFRIPAGTTMQLKKFCIYDRWGRLVFSTHDISRGWDGKVNGMNATGGVYVYVITGSDYKGDREVKGTFVLIR